MAFEDPFTEVAHMGNALSHLHVLQVTPLLPSRSATLKAVSPRQKLNYQEEKNLYFHHNETHEVHSLRNACTGITRAEKTFQLHKADLPSFVG